MIAMEGVATAVAVKLPSFKIIRRTTTLNWRSSRSFRSFSASASTPREGGPSASVSVSLGDFDPTRFPNPQSPSVLPIEDIVLQSHNVEAKVLVDACQSVPHMVVDVQNLDADFLFASSHKMCGPTATGIGFLYGKSHLLSTMPPFLGGGEMISDVFLDHSTYA